MNDNRNTILAVILSGIVLIAWQYFYNMPQMERQRAAQQVQSELAKTQPPAGNASTPAAPATSANPPAQTPAAASRIGQAGGCHSDATAS